MGKVGRLIGIWMSHLNRPGCRLERLFVVQRDLLFSAVRQSQQAWKYFGSPLSYAMSLDRVGGESQSLS